MKQSIRVTCASCERVIYRHADITPDNRREVVERAFSMMRVGPAHLEFLGCDRFLPNVSFTTEDA